MTNEAIDLLDYVVRRGGGVLYVIARADGPALSLPNATPALITAVAAEPRTHRRALQELVDRGYLWLEHDSRMEGGAELRYVVTNPGRNDLNRFAPRTA